MKELDALFEKYEKLVLKKETLKKEVAALKEVQKITMTSATSEMQSEIEKILS